MLLHLAIAAALVLATVLVHAAFTVWVVRRVRSSTFRARALGTPVTRTLEVALLVFLASAVTVVESGLWAGTYLGLVACHIILIMPYALRLVLASVTGMDRSAEAAARSLGATRWVTFRRVTVPLILPGVTGGWVLAFITSFDELTMTIFIASPSSTTLPVRMYQHITETIDPLIASVSAVIIFITMIMMVILDRIFGLDKLLVGK